MVCLGIALLPASTPAWADSPECRRFHRDPGLTPLCERLVAASVAGALTAEDSAVATQLGRFLAIIGELDLRKGAFGFGAVAPSHARPTNYVARYLIAREIGLHAIVRTQESAVAAVAE